jgi:hypothetical protein
LKAKANSKNPRNTFTVFNHPPDFGKEFIQPGNNANKVKGKESASENPNIPTNGAIPPMDADSTKRVPTIGPVHEKETNASAKAMKKIPIKPPLFDEESALFNQEFGNIISKAPMNEIAKITSRMKNIILNHTFVDKALSAEAPKTAVTMVPRMM